MVHRLISHPQIKYKYTYSPIDFVCACMCILYILYILSIIFNIWFALYKTLGYAFPDLMRTAILWFWIHEYSYFTCCLNGREPKFLSFLFFSFGAKTSALFNIKIIFNPKRINSLNMFYIKHNMVDELICGKLSNG